MLKLVCLSTGYETFKVVVNFVRLLEQSKGFALDFIFGGTTDLALIHLAFALGADKHGGTVLGGKPALVEEKLVDLKEGFGLGIGCDNHQTVKGLGAELHFELLFPHAEVFHEPGTLTKLQPVLPASQEPRSADIPGRVIALHVEAFQGGEAFVVFSLEGVHDVSAITRGSLEEESFSEKHARAILEQGTRSSQLK
jgi:hypothetical protein